MVRIFMRLSLVLALAAAMPMVTPSSGGSYELEAQKVDVKDLLPRVADYIQTFITSFSNVVAEESYKQEITSPHRKRQLKSDLMLVKYPGADGWLVFRDTFDVDGKSVRAEPERLTKLFLEPPDNAIRRAREIASASEKFNLVNIGTINNPLIVLAMMQGENQPRFRYTMGNIEKSLGPDVRVLQFREIQTPTMIKIGGNSDIFSTGLLWVEQATGRVVKTQLNIGRRGTGIQIETTFQEDSELGIDVPVRMKEWYPDGFGGGDIMGEATYGRFRRFQVSTEQELRN